MIFTFWMFVFVTYATAVLCRDTTDVQAELNCTKEVLGDLGQDVTLNCSLKPPQNLTRKPHEWKFNRSSGVPVDVLVYKNQGYYYPDQDEQFKGRATNSSFCSLSEGRLSVNITNLTTDDSGTYSCHVHKLEKPTSCRTELRIVDPKEASENSNKTLIDTDSNDKNTGNSTAETAGISVGIIVGIIVGLLAVIGAAYCIWWRCRNCERQERPDPQRKNDDGTSAGCEATPLNHRGNNDSSREEVADSPIG